MKVTVTYHDSRTDIFEGILMVEVKYNALYITISHERIEIIQMAGVEFFRVYPA